jgi:hypothetical protein
MIRRNRHITQRPEYFTLDPCHDLARGLVFAGFGRFPKGFRYDDATESMWGGGNHGTLTNMDPASDWVWVPELGRWATKFNGNSQLVRVVRGMVRSYPFAMGCWVKLANTSAEHRVMQLAVTSYGSKYAMITSPPARGWEYQVRNDGSFDSTNFAVANGGSLSTKWQYIWVQSPSLAVHQLWVDGSLVDTDTNSSGVDAYDQCGIGGEVDIVPVYAAATIADPAIFAGRTLSPSEIARLADPSNIMLDGLLVAPGRTVFPTAVVDATAKPWIYYQALRMNGAA